ncbi:MAG: CaiB/BaiF CoA transferase family protein [Acidimicrobiales bacterium]|jgi:crotonobetainyl-CoA:carnitine CoA-transferase CaiB-like acyl-CoA transferase|nr:CoA transferase [Actinomycetota bacterium]MEC9089610.1 CoA transferase [Actinomycetota bacterium]|tara:strand:- start:5183 stop:6418 length:1236 start_codon:yes stop_codon:yes gene_type:complete
MEEHLTAHEDVTPMANAATGPLQGIRILDCTQAIAGPWSTMMLGDLGADVIKVEAPRGDLQRPMAPYTREDKERSYGGSFSTYNRNKRGIVLDFNKAEDKEQFLALVETADAVVENMRAGVMDNLGLGWETLRERNPRLVYGAIRGFGDPRTGASPHADWPAYDVIAQAMGGLVSQNGNGPENRIQVGPFIGDIYPGTIGAMGVLAALFHAQRTGEGQFVDVAMVDSIMALAEMGVMRYSYLGRPDTPPSGNRNDFAVPFDVFETKDGSMAIAAPTDHHWQELATAMGHPEWGADEDKATIRARVLNREPLDKALTEWAKDRTNQEILDLIGGKVPCGPVNLPGDLFSDPHVEAREMLVAVEQPSGRPIVQVASPIKMTKTPTGIHRRAPRLGEHTDEVLGEIDELRGRFD